MLKYSNESHAFDNLASSEETGYGKIRLSLYIEILFFMF